MTTQSRFLTGLLQFGLLLLVPALTLAGPNEGGTLILHANPSLVFTSDTQNYCGVSALDSCSAAVTSVAWDPGKKIVFHVLAAFPVASSPRLKALSFGIEYDPTKFMVAARGSCADFELSDGTWPAPGTGTSQSWTTGAQTGMLTEAYWFAGYAYSEQDGEDSTTVALIPHPVQHGVFVDDAFPAEVDTIAGYGRLGFGTAGALPCPGYQGEVIWVPGALVDEPDDVDARDDNLYLSRFRWLTPTDNIPINFGHLDLDANLTRSQARAELEEAALAWTNYFLWGWRFTFSDQGAQWYPVEEDGISTVNWADCDGCFGTYAGTWVELDYRAGCGDCWDRIRAVDIRFWEQYDAHNLCWVDCGAPHGACLPDGVDWSIDIQTMARHEWGHVVGIELYEPTDWNQSIMGHEWESPPECRQRYLGPADVEFAQGAYAGLEMDVDEPQNDCWSGAYDLGQLMPHGEVSNGWADRLPGYIDVDIFKFSVATVNPNADLWFQVSHGGDPGISYWMDLYCDHWFRGSFWAPPNSNIYAELPPETGLWEVKIRTDDGSSAPSRYQFRVIYHEPTTEVPEHDESGGERIDLAVNPITRLASGSGLRHPGDLALFNAGGRLIWSRTLAPGGYWSQPIDARLSSGIYFLRLADRSKSTTRRLVVVK